MRIVTLEERISLPDMVSIRPTVRAQAGWPIASGPELPVHARQAKRPCTCCAPFSRAHSTNYPRLQLTTGHMDETLPVMMARCDQTVPRKKTQLTRIITQALRD